jgi:maleylpyruvate isomerase
VDAAQRRLIDHIDQATQRLLDDARTIPEPDLRAPSLLPGWTRAHVLAHLARGADAMRNLLVGVRSGQARAAYASAQARAADIERTAAVSAMDLVTDLADSAMALRTVARQLPGRAWQVQVRVLDSVPFPAAGLLTRRLVEVELHHCDLATGYSAADWPEAFAGMELTEPMRSQRLDRLSYPPPSAGPKRASSGRPVAPWKPGQRLPGSWLGSADDSRPLPAQPIALPIGGRRPLGDLGRRRGGRSCILVVGRLAGEGVMRLRRSPKFALDVTGLVLAAALFASATQLHPPWWNLCLGIGTSFVFIAVSDLLNAAHARILDASRVSFFGRELVRGTATFVYPDFEPHEDVTRTLEANGLGMRYQRPPSKVRPLVDFWIDAPFTAASNDLEAILYVAGIFGGFSAGPDSLITDRRLIKACNRSFLSFGLGSSACTYLYLDHSGANTLFELLPESSSLPAKMYLRTRDGREFHSDSHLQYGLIARYAPDRVSLPHRRWFIIAGLGPAGTIGAAWYLAQNWRSLARNIPADEDFAALVTVPVIAPTSAHLQDGDIVLSSSPGGLLKIPSRQASGVTN